MTVLLQAVSGMITPKKSNHSRSLFAQQAQPGFQMQPFICAKIRIKFKIKESERMQWWEFCCKQCLEWWFQAIIKSFQILVCSPSPTRFPNATFLYFINSIKRFSSHTFYHQKILERMLLLEAASSTISNFQ